MKRSKRKVLIITGSRGEYGYIKPIIDMMRTSEGLEPEILATNMHLLPEFGNSINEFENDGIEVKHKVYMTLAGYTNATMIKSLGIFMLSLTDLVCSNNPDIILLAGDRGEQLVGAMVGAHLNIPVAHIQAGELSGNVDGLTRHAITRFAHIHFASNEDAEKRLIKSGEEPFRVFRVGAPQLDDFKRGRVATAEEVARKFNIDISQGLILVLQHPVTEQATQAEAQMTATMDAVLAMEMPTVVIYPNNDAGSTAIQKCIQRMRSVNVRVERNVAREYYAGLMNVASAMVGNSSSGILEAPSFGLPAVNIGRRQNGRLQGKNIINVPEHDATAIREALRKAISAEFREALQGMENPYGDGKASERIVSILKTVQINEQLIYKQITY